MAVLDTPQAAFAALRPLCAELARARTRDNVRRLQAALGGVGAAALQELQLYVLFPLRAALRGPPRVAQAALQCVAVVLGATRLRERRLAPELLSELCGCLAPPAAADEELALAAARALRALLHAADPAALGALYAPRALPLLGFAVSLLLARAERERARHVKAAALDALRALLRLCECPAHAPLARDEAQRCGGLFAAFLPGLALTLARVATADVKQGHAPTAAAVRLFGHVVGFVMADEQLDSVPESPEKPPEEDGKIAELMVHRGPEWSKSTAEKLALLLQKIVESASVHPHWRVRLELVELVSHLLQRCRRSLLGSFAHLLKALVGLVNDESDQVQARCREVLQSVAEQGIVTGNRALADVLSENLHGLATALPRLVNSQDDQGKFATLSLFLGYLKLLGPKINVVLNSAAHLQRVSRALMQVLELDVTDVKIVEERRRGRESPREPAGGPRSGRRQRKYFRFFAEEKVFLLLQQVCRVLGYYGNLYLLVDHFLGLYAESAAYRRQAALVLNELLAGAAGLGVEALRDREDPVNVDDLKGSITSVLDEYTDPANWYLVTSIDTGEAGAESSVQLPGFPARPGSARGSLLAPSPDPQPSTRTMNGNIWQICIQLEGISCFAAVLGKDFRLLLLSALYPVLEKAGDQTLLISETAVGTLVDICEACGYASVQCLINDNSDYLVNGISLNLRQRAHQPRASRVLDTMLRHSDASLLPLVEDVIQDVLATLDHTYDNQASTFLGVLYSLMAALVRWFGAAGGEDGRGGQATERRPAQQPPATSRDLERFFLDYVRQKRIAEGDVPDSDDEEAELVPPPAEAEPHGSEAEGEPRLPSHAQLAKDVLERCIHLLSHGSLRVRLQVLDVLELCVTVLHPHGNHLLPLAHRVWPALVTRLISDDPLAVLRAFKVLCTLAEKCGDFLRQRFSKDVLPKLASSLLSQAPASARAGPVYSHTLAFKLQLAVLQGLGPLCEKLDMGESDLDKVAGASVVYLSARQPRRLQEAARSVFLHLMRVDPDATWLLLSELCPAQPCEPPHPSLRPARLPGAAPRSEFSANAMLLLETLRRQEHTAPPGAQEAPPGAPGAQEAPPGAQEAPPP